LVISGIRGSISVAIPLCGSSADAGAGGAADPQSWHRPRTDCKLRCTRCSLWSNRGTCLRRRTPPSTTDGFCRRERCPVQLRQVSQSLDAPSRHTHTLGAVALFRARLSRPHPRPNGAVFQDWLARATAVVIQVKLDGVQRPRRANQTQCRHGLLRPTPPIYTHGPTSAMSP
jgi:hypothetical protein